MKTFSTENLKFSSAKNIAINDLVLNPTLKKSGDIFKHNVLKIKVIPNSSQTKLIVEHNALKLYLKAQPQKGKANQAIIKFFKKQFNLYVEIKHGATSRIKTLQIIN